MQKLSHQIYSFDGFALDLTRGCLLHGREEIKLRPKSFEALKYLVENNRRLISKNELIHAVWVDTAVTDDSLVKCLKDIRHALSDETQQIIKTVHGRGYIFDKDVRDNNSGQVTNYTESAESLLSTNAERVNSRQNVRPGRAIESIAVLPFVNATNDVEAEHLAEGITESIINSLSHIPELRVMARSTVFRYQGKDVSPREVGRDLNVNAVLTGRVLQLGGRLVIGTELVDVTDGSQLWGERY